MAVPAPSSRPLAVFDVDSGAGRRHPPAAPSAGAAAAGGSSAADRDPLLVEGAERLRVALVDHDVVYLTGRPERTRRLTERWPATTSRPGR